MLAERGGKMTRDEKAKLHRDLIDILTSCEDDKAYYERMVYSLQIISNELTYFKIQEEEK
jgi:hypothetical protein